MNCPTCNAENRPGASRCRRCHAPLLPSCLGCGAPVADEAGVCADCRTAPRALLAGERRDDGGGGGDDGDRTVVVRTSIAAGADFHLPLDGAPELASEDVPSLDFLPRFVGRGPLLARLREALESCCQTRQPVLVLLTGDSGLGKSRLLREFAWSSHRDQVSGRVLLADAGGPGAPPFATYARLLGSRLGISDGEPAATAHDKIETAVRESLSSLSESRATEVAHLLGQLIGFPFPDSPVVDQLSQIPTQLEARMFIAVRRLLAADAACGPVVLCIDEAERLGPETVRLTRYLLAGLASLPLLVLVAGRPTLFEQHPELVEGDPDHAPLRLELCPLSPAESELVLRDLLRPVRDLPDSLVVHARERLQGSPRALVEFCRFLLESSILEGEEAGLRVHQGRLQATALPRSQAEVLAARLQAMPAAERSLLEGAAVCGERFWVDALTSLVRSERLATEPDGPSLAEMAAIAERTQSAVNDGLRQLIDRELVLECPHSSLAGEREIRFAYPLLRDVVYRGIPDGPRRQRHRLLAQWLELRPEGQFSEGRDPRGEGGTRSKAGAQAIAGLAGTAGPPAVSASQTTAASGTAAAIRSGRFEREEAVAGHLEQSGNLEKAAVRFGNAGNAASDRYFNDKAVRLYSRALTCLAERGDLVLRMQLWHDLGSVFALKGDYEPALAAFERMLRLAFVLTSRAKSAVAHNKMGRVWRQKGDLRLALEHLERGLDLFRSVDDRRGIAGSLDDVGQVLWMLGRYDEALSRSAAALEERRRLGDPRSVAVSLSNVGNIEQERGLFREAEACYLEALELRRSVGDRAGVAASLNNLGVLWQRRGDLEQARAAWQEGLEIAEQIGALPLHGLLLSNLAEAALQQGKAAEARQRLGDTLQIARDLNDRRILTEATRNLGLLELSQGNHEGARALCRRALEMAEKAGLREFVGRALLALAEVHAATLFDETVTAETSERAEDLYRRAADLFREIGAGPDLARALERLGRLQVEAGDVEGGRALLLEAQVIYQRLGSRQAQALRAVLAELGVRS